jgi:hypothetical protein
MKLGIFFMAALAVVFELSVGGLAQQTLGGITGTVTDSSGSVLPDTSVTIVGDQTKLTHAQNQRQRRLRLRQPADWHLHGDGGA